MSRTPDPRRDPRQHPPLGGSSTSRVEPLRNADNQRKHGRHTFLLHGEALLHRSEPDLHRREAAFHRGEAAFHRGETVLKVAYLSGQGQNARAEQLKTDPFVAHRLISDTIPLTSLVGAAGLEPATR